MPWISKKKRFEGHLNRVKNMIIIILDKKRGINEQQVFQEDMIIMM